VPKNSTKALALKPVIEKAVEVYASKPDIQHKDAAKMLKISENTLLRLRRDPSFWAQVYDYYMVTFEGDVVGVLRAMVREGLAGNVQAGRLVLEHSGKLQKNINVTISSPYEKWLEKVEGGKIEDAEIVEDLKEIDDDFSDLPPRSADKGTWKARNDHANVRKVITKEERRIRRNKARKIMRQWQKRANAVGVDPLPARRPTPGQRKAWEKEIIRREKQALEHPREQAGNSNTPCKQKNQKQGSPKTATQPKS
tara:strand:+ start:742 stop:1500 length:759 start_codon:yes stop_codon:yes gene_type:complete